jgi:cytochrome c oxidase assembly protein subunit 15
MTDRTLGSVAYAPAATRPTGAGAVALWLWLVAALVFLMVVVGGATRLTESGLSITEWQPVSGVVPPLSLAAWEDAFAKYRQIPQYARLFPDMTLGQFQFIFLWEWTHRLLGRLIGVAFAVPLIAFWLRGRLPAGLAPKLTGVLALGALQGAVGWWMVSSGLTGRVEVAQERLAIHLVLASVTFALLVWLAASLRAAPARAAAPAGLRALAGVLVGGVLLQIGLGGLVAGLRAGLTDNTWPLIDGHFIPPAAVLGAMTPLWRNLVDNVTTVQFDHRMLAYALFLLALAQAALTLWRWPGTRAARRAVALAGLVTVQATLGVVTLLLVVPLWAGLLHQAFAMLVLGMAVVHAQALGKGR